MYESAKYQRQCPFNLLALFNRQSSSLLPTPAALSYLISREDNYRSRSLLSALLHSIKSIHVDTFAAISLYLRLQYPFKSDADDIADARADFTASLYAISVYAQLRTRLLLRSIIIACWSARAVTLRTRYIGTLYVGITDS